MAGDINHLVLIGRLTRDCGQQDFTYTPGGTARANVSMAVNRTRKNGDQLVEETSFFDITIWGKTAENLHPYLTKGKQIGVTGYLKQDRWEKDGQKFSKVHVVAEDVQLLGSKNDGGTQGGSQNTGSSGTYQQNRGYAPRRQTGIQSEDSFPEDVPF